MPEEKEQEPVLSGFESLALGSLAAQMMRWVSPEVVSQYDGTVKAVSKGDAARWGISEEGVFDIAFPSVMAAARYIEASELGGRSQLRRPVTYLSLPCVLQVDLRDAR